MRILFSGHRFFICLPLHILFPLFLFAQTGRQIVPLDDNWQFHFAYDVRQKNDVRPVTLPHTWNAQQTLNGVMNYTRDAAVYERKIAFAPAWKGKRFFLYFEGVNSFAQVLVNHHFVGEHKGGYTAFCLEITSYLQAGKENLLTVEVSNAARPDILPLTGDFNIYGGIHRPVHLIVTDRNCISPLDYASSGVYLTPVAVTDSLATISIKTQLSIADTVSSFSLQTIVKDAGGNIVAQKQHPISASVTEDISSIPISSPHLWNGRKDPYLYKTIVQLWNGAKIVDEIVQPLGIRNYIVRADSGFFLNGKYLDLRGFGLHQDLAGKGSAMDDHDLKQDMDLVMESGATALRLTHYPHSEYFYRLADSAGIALWSEIPLVGPGGYKGYGYINNPALHQQATQLMIEMIRQNYNHPSIFFWGLFNELKLDYDDPVPFLNELNTLAKKEDSTRSTTCATFLDNDIYNTVSDVIAWNKYYGWYGGKFGDVAQWADETRKKYPSKPFAISEYGAGASPDQHSDEWKAPDPGGKFHPEEWQSLFHEAYWKALASRPFVWGKFIWCLADFGSSIRTEGEYKGINDKGLVSYDRKIKKDAFYFYKANWNEAPMVYIASRRYRKRLYAKTDIKVYSNQAKVTLYLNGKGIGTQSPDAYKMIVWKDVILKKGINKVEASAEGITQTLRDSCEWIY